MNPTQFEKQTDQVVASRVGVPEQGGNVLQRSALGEQPACRATDTGVPVSPQKPQRRGAFPPVSGPGHQDCHSTLLLPHLPLSPLQTPSCRAPGWGLCHLDRSTFPPPGMLPDYQLPSSFPSQMTPQNCPGPCYSDCGPQTSAFHATGEHARRAESQTRSRAPIHPMPFLFG